MKNFITISMVAVTVLLCTDINAQINWRSVQPEQRHMINLNVGWDYAAVVGVGYGYKFNTRLPLLANLDVSLPSGTDVFDDVKVKGGGQAELFRYRNFSASLAIKGIFRRYESELVRFANFGSEFSAVIGYYRPRWYAAIEAGFDKAIVTHVKHRPVMREYYPEIKDGWYIPSGGNLFYGIQGGYSFRSIDTFLKAGQLITQDFRTRPSVPFYVSVGVGCRLKAKG